jgi:hypothetical protein
MEVALVNFTILFGFDTSDNTSVHPLPLVCCAIVLCKFSFARWLVVLEFSDEFVLVWENLVAF